MKRAPKRRSALNRWRQILPAPWQQSRGQLRQRGSVSCRFASQRQRHYANMSVAAGCGKTPPVAWPTTVPGGWFKRLEVREEDHQTGLARRPLWRLIVLVGGRRQQMPAARREHGTAVIAL
jgi:hypothetical protein